MANAVSAIKDQFAGNPMRDAINTALASHGLTALSTTAPIRRHRRQLKGAARLPALAVELGRLTGRSEGAGGLRSMAGEATYYLALGRADDTSLLALAEQYVDAIRETVETELAGGFQRLTFAGAEPEGQPCTEAGLMLRVVPVAFAFQWLYAAGDY